MRRHPKYFIAVVIGLVAASIVAAAPLPGTASAQDGTPDGSFRVSWAPRSWGGVPMIEGHVQNQLPYRVTNVRLQVVGVDGDDRPVGQRSAWALGDIPPGGESTFVVERVPGAVSYRIGIQSFHVVSSAPEAP